MYILSLHQDGDETEIGIFNSLEEGREFISKLDAYQAEEEDGFLFESLALDKIPTYVEVTYKGNIVPFSRFMFRGDSDVDIFWSEIFNLSEEGSGMVPSATLVDAYGVNNEDVKGYIERREANFKRAKEFLEEKGYEVTRAYFGSEDGEAILYKEAGSDDWHFLTHMDPGFADGDDLDIVLEEFEK